MTTSANTIVSGRKDRSWYALWMAATLLFVLIAAVIYQYATLNSANLFKASFSPYTISAGHGNNQQDTLEKLYQDRQYDVLIEQFAQLSDPDIYDRFLAGNSYLLKQEPAKAIQEFLIIQRHNKQAKEHVWEEETDYYLAMAYLKLDQPGKALPIVESMHANPRHSYHDKITGIQLAKLKWLSGKRGI